MLSRVATPQDCGGSCCIGQHRCMVVPCKRTTEDVGTLPHPCSAIQ